MNMNVLKLLMLQFWKLKIFGMVIVWTPGCLCICKKGFLWYYFVLVSRISIWLEADDNYFPGKQRAKSQMMRKNLMR